MKKKIQVTDYKNLRFLKSPILKIFLLKFHGLGLGLVRLIDAKGIDVAQVFPKKIVGFTYDI